MSSPDGPRECEHGSCHAKIDWRSARAWLNFLFVTLKISILTALAIVISVGGAQVLAAYYPHILNPYGSPNQFLSKTILSVAAGILWLVFLYRIFRASARAAIANKAPTWPYVDSGIAWLSAVSWGIVMAATTFALASYALEILGADFGSMPAQLGVGLSMMSAFHGRHYLISKLRFSDN